MKRSVLFMLVALSGCVTAKEGQLETTSFHIVGAETRVLSRVKPSETFAPILESTILHYAQEMNKTQPGQVGYAVRVNVKAFRYKDAAMSLLVGDANSINTNIEVFDPATNRVVKSFDAAYVDGASAIVNGVTGAVLAATVDKSAADKTLAKGLTTRIVKTLYDVKEVPIEIRRDLNKRDMAIPPTGSVSPLVPSQSLETALTPIDGNNQE